jgi:DNA-nicking Smr family endonuclease
MAKPSQYGSFEELGGLLKSLKKSAPPPAAVKKRPVPPPPPSISEEEAFSQAMENVHPLGWSNVPLPEFPPIEIQNPQQSEDEGLRLLQEFVAGKGLFELRFTDEYIEGFPDPEGRFYLKELHTGAFSVRAQLDLHGASREEAHEKLEDFIRHSLQQGVGCVKIIHGRGQHSQSGRPVLKEHLQKWLMSRRMGKFVLAFTSAQLADGGAGAVYVLLCRTPKRQA